LDETLRDRFTQLQRGNSFTYFFTFRS